MAAITSKSDPKLTYLTTKREMDNKHTTENAAKSKYIIKGLNPFML